jgi:hypothetical protein
VTISITTSLPHHVTFAGMPDEMLALVVALRATAADMEAGLGVENPGLITVNDPGLARDPAFVKAVTDAVSAELARRSQRGRSPFA